MPRELWELSVLQPAGAATMKRFECPDCGLVWFYPLHYTAQIEKFKSGSSYWSGAEDRVNICPNCGHSPFPEQRWWMQSWRPESNNYWREVQP